LVPDWRPFRDRHGDLTFNTIAAVSFDLLFLYVLPEYEGSAHDSTLLEFALNTDLKMPSKRWFLGDAGFPLCDVVMTPWRGVRYHLQEWKNLADRQVVPYVYVHSAPGHRTHLPVHLSRAEGLVRDHFELFNLRHASARNAVERVFGVMKKRFKVLDDPMHYSIGIQAQLLPGLCALHNFLRMKNDPQLEARLVVEEENARGLNPEEEVQRRQDRRGEERWEDKRPGRNESDVRRRARMEGNRERIAMHMWEDYQNYRDL
jgi:hypothetical protein